MTIKFVGGSPTDPGPIGLIARFLLAADADDEDAAALLLTENSRQGFDLGSISIDSGTASFEDLVPEEGEIVVSTLIEDEDGAEEMPFIVREEDGELLIDFDATIARMMGVSMDDLFDDTDDGPPEPESRGVGRFLTANIQTLAEGASPLDAFEDPPGDNEPGQWHIPDPAAAAFRDGILDSAYTLAQMLRPSFHPSRDKVDSDAWEAEGASVTTARHGTGERGFQRNETVSDTVDGHCHTVEVAGYGLPGDQELRLMWMDTTAPGEAEELTVFVQVVAPVETHDRIREHLAQTFAWEDPLE